MYMENKSLCCGSTRLTAERAERVKDVSEQQLEKKGKKSTVIGKRNWTLSVRICADLNRNPVAEPSAR